MKHLGLIARSKSCSNCNKELFGQHTKKLRMTILGNAKTEFVRALETLFQIETAVFLTPIFAYLVTCYLSLVHTDMQQASAITN